MGHGARGTPVSISKRDKTIVADIDLEKRFYSSPDGVRLNVSAGLAVPLMSDCKQEESWSQPTQLNPTTTAIPVKELPTDGKWRLTVRPIQIAVNREHVLGLST